LGRKFKTLTVNEGDYMKVLKYTIALASLCLLSACAGLNFGDEGVTYYEPTPYLFVSLNKECVSTATVVSLPGKKRSVKFTKGYGSADLSIAMSNGILTNVGQKTDSKVPETITSIAALGTAMAAIKAFEKPQKQVVCVPTATLYEIKNGVPDSSSPIAFPIDTKIIEDGK
jgi:hypothetical protein